MDITKSSLYQAFRKLSQNSEKSVQSGRSLSDLDSYLHVERPIEKILRNKMDEVDRNGGGIVLLVGSAGDGKSHLLSRIRRDYNWGDDSFYNDATASCSPTKTAVQTLKEALVDFCDSAIDTTKRKLVLAINLGKLNAFIEDEEVKNSYSKIVNATIGIFDGDDATDEVETERIKIVLFTKEQVFELITGSYENVPVTSNFLSTILEKIVSENDDNPFHIAYRHDKQQEGLKESPVLINYEILRSKSVRETLVKTVIEAIVRFKLIITPREFLDFIFSILIYEDIDHYNEKDTYYKALLPTLFYCGGTNLILKAVAKLDPVLYSNTGHDKDLATLFTSYAIPNESESRMLEAGVPACVVKRVNTFYKNNGRDLEATTKFVFRLCHLLSYHSESTVYNEFISLLPRVLTSDTEAMSYVYEMVARALPRHFGSFYERSNMIPIEVQGGKYKLFTSLDFEPQPIESIFDSNHPTCFPLYINLSWAIGEKRIQLKVDYQLYTYLSDLDHGRVVTSYEHGRSTTFGTFARELSSMSNQGEVMIVKFDGTEKKLKNIFGNVRLG